MPKQRIKSPEVTVGDKVGISIIRVNKFREVVGTKVVATGIVTRVYRNTGRQRWRVEVEPPDKAAWFMYTGHHNWAYLHEVTLVARASRIGKRPGDK